MDGQNSQAKLTRTHSSSLLRSSPTVRSSSIHSLTSASSALLETPDVEEQKPHSKKPASNPVRRTGLAPVLAVLIVSSYALFVFFSVPTAEKSVLFSLTFVALLLFLASRNMPMVSRNLAYCRRLCGGCGKRLSLWRFTSARKGPRPVHWFIGEPTSKTEEKENDVVAVNTVKEGIEFYSNGDLYEGEFYRGKCNGSGVYNYFANGRYEGDWVDGRYDGYGIESWSKGSRYKGQYRQGLRHGYGVYKFYRGDSYSGEWRGGQSHGVGVQTCADGSCYVGEFKSGVKHGLGCYHFRNGDRYAGEYFADKPHGFGVYHFSNGHIYEGSWHEGRKQGYGSYTFRNGESRGGEWDGGNLKNTLSPKGEAVVKAVQAARRTSENAVRIRRVDDHVERAVMAANRAATGARVAAVKAVQNRIVTNFCDGAEY